MPAGPIWAAARSISSTAAWRLPRRRNEGQERELLGVEQWIDGATGKEAILRFLYDPTLNIDGIWGGYTGVGVKTILPHKVTAKVDSRLPPNLGPMRHWPRFVSISTRMDLPTSRFASFPVTLHLKHRSKRRWCRPRLVSSIITATHRSFGPVWPVALLSISLRRGSDYRWSWAPWVTVREPTLPTSTW